MKDIFGFGAANNYIREMDHRKSRRDIRAVQKYQHYPTYHVIKFDLMHEIQQHEKKRRDALVESLKNAKTFGEVFKTARLLQGLTQDQLAKIVNCSIMSIYYYENDIKYPRRLDVEKFENILGVKLKHFIPDENENKIPNIAEKIKEARLAKELTRQQLADILGCHVNTVTRWERKERYPLPSYISKMEEILDVKFRKMNT